MRNGGAREPSAIRARRWAAFLGLIRCRQLAQSTLIPDRAAHCTTPRPLPRLLAAIAVAERSSAALVPTLHSVLRLPRYASSKAAIAALGVHLQGIQYGSSSPAPGRMLDSASSERARRPAFSPTAGEQGGRIMYAEEADISPTGSIAHQTARTASGSRVALLD